MTKTYGHFCPVAFALEKIGDKWSLLIIRDLLSGPQRFTDLLGYLNHITPKWLTQRLRELESAGIIERDQKTGRRQVWYKLTAAGNALAPIVEALAMWGFRYALRPPLPGEVVHPDRLIRALTLSLNKKGKRLPRPARWVMQFPQGRYSLTYNRETWSGRREESPDSDLTISTTPETWATVFTAPRSDRGRLAQDIKLDGAPERIEEFRQTFGLQKEKDRMGSKVSPNNHKRTGGPAEEKSKDNSKAKKKISSGSKGKSTNQPQRTKRT